MELTLSEDQEFFLATTRKFLAAVAPIGVVRSLESEPAGFTADYWRQGCELGWTSMLVSEADGGGSLSEHGLADLALVAEEMGRLVSPGPLVPVNVVAAALSAGGTPSQKAEVLGALIDGTAVAAWTGPVPLPATHTDGTYTITGSATAVEAGAQAGYLLVAVRDEDDGGDATLLLVPTDAPGLTVAAMGGLDLVRRYAEVRFEAVVVPESAVVGPPGAATEESGRLLRIAAVLGCAEMAGAAERCFEMTLDYLGDRYSFGRPLASYQALKHRLADDKMRLEACHATTSAAVAAVAADAPEAAELTSVAKAWVGPHATEIVQDCIQLHGGIGVTWEHDLHLYLRRATVLRATYGSPQEHRERLATIALGEAS